MARAASGLRERIRALPGMERLLPALDGLPPTFLVGGAIRDLLRGSPSADLDLAVEGDARQAARALADRLGATALVHERFGTATLRLGRLSVDLATTRRERYDRPGALPRVESATLEEDLARRDFSVNAMAASLSGDQLGRLHDPHGGVADLDARAVRVLHDASFTDDPTRLLRAVRYELRLDFSMEQDTEQLAREAVAGGALATVSGQRVRDELLDLLAEPQAPAGVRRLAELEVLEALHPALAPHAELVAGALLGSLETGADRALAALAALTWESPGALAGWLEWLGLPRESRDAVLVAAREGGRIVTALRRLPKPSELYELLSDKPPEALALALALGAPAEPVLRYLSELRHVRLDITGDDLVAAGVPPSPAIGRALEVTLHRKLDGLVSGREQELQLALELARSWREE